MENHAGKVAGFLVLIGICISIPSNSLGSQKKKGGRIVRTADVVWNTFKSPGSFLEADIDACRADADCYPQLAEKWRKAGTDEKALALRHFVEIGGLLKPSEEGQPRRYGPYLVEENLIEVVVEALSQGNSELMDKASQILARETPDSLVRNHASAIENALIKHPGLVEGARLLGKLGSEKALKILKGSPVLQDEDPLVLQAVLGKLGDSRQETHLVDAYLKAMEPREKHRLALLLGYMAKPKSLMVLARDIRTAFHYEWNQKGKRSFRLHVIEALSLAYPMEPVLWKPYSNPRDDEYYSEVEAWAHRALGVEWAVPRPPFLYEDQVPMGKPPMRR